MIKAVLFDFDGTLIDTNNLIRSSHNYAFNKIFQRDITEKEFLKLYGRPLKSALNSEYGEYGDALLSEYLVFNEKNHDTLVNKFDGAVSGVLKLKDMGFKLGIVTSKRLCTLEKGIEILNLENVFDILITPADTTKHKPNPEPILIACEKLNITPEDAIYVGDSVFDLEAGKGAGTKLCAVSYSLTEKEKLMSYNPDFYVDSIEQLSELLV